jgi:Zn-dependent oligopeptidase
MFYQKVEEENNIFWIESKKLDKVPTSIMAKWHYTPRSHRVGLMRLHGTISHVTAYVEDQKLRQQLTDWDANSCEHLAPFFKEILEMRANLAKSYGFNNYMDYQAQYKLLDRRSAENFLNQLKRHFLPRIASHTNELFKMKLRDMGYHLTFETLRDNLKYYNHTILDFQDEHPKYRLDVGEVARYTWLKRKKNGSLDSFKYMEYFPLQSTARRLLDVIPPVFGLKFEELLLDGKDYTNVMTDYLKSGQSSSTISDKEEKLLIFAVKDSRFPKIGYPMGYVVLDLLRRPGKVQNGHCRRFGNVCTTPPLVSMH